MKVSARFLVGIIITIAILSLIGIGYIPAEAVDSPEYKLFLADGSLIQSGEGQAGCPFSSMAQKSREIKINDLLLAPGIVAPDDRLIMDLPGEFSYAATIDRVDVDVNGTLSLRGRIDGDEYGYILLSASAGKVLATIRNFSEGTKHIISYDSSSGSNHLHEIDPGETVHWIENSTTSLTPPGEERGQTFYSPQSLPEVEEDVVIDVMIVYTPAAKEYAAQTTGINSFVAQAMEHSQLALDNSETGIILRLVHSGEVEYTEFGDEEVSGIAMDLLRLMRTDDGYMDEVHVWRDEYGADLVNLFTLEHHSGGQAWILNDTSGRPAQAFSITRVQQASWTYTMAHEMAHNMGCHHSKYQTVQRGPGIFDYSAGWRWTGSDNEKYASVMAYSEGIYTIVPYFSNPDILFKNTPTGHHLHGDNARTLRQTKAVIAGYRDTIKLDSPVLNQATNDNTIYEDLIITFEDNQAWRDTIVSVFVNDMEIASDDYVIEAGKLTFHRGVFPQRGYYNIRVVAGGYIDSILSQFVKGPTDIISFSFAEETVPANINPVELTVDTEVAYGTDLTNLTADFTLLKDATARVGEVLQVSGETENDFSKPVTYTVIAEDGSSNDWVVSVELGSIPVKSIELNATEIELKAGEKFELEAIISPVNATDKSLSWTSGNEEVATVEPLIILNQVPDTYRKAGVVTPHNPGTTAITVRSEGSNVEGVCVVDVFFGYGILRGTDIDVVDAILLLRHIVGLDSLDRAQQKAASVSGSGIIRITDVILILQKVAGLITEFPVEIQNNQGITSEPFPLYGNIFLCSAQ